MGSIAMIQSNEFPKYFLALNSASLGNGRGSTGGSVTGQTTLQRVNYRAGAKVTISTIDGTGAFLNTNGTSVNLIRGQSFPSEEFIIRKSGNTVAFESVAFPTKFLSVDGNGKFGMQPRNHTWEKFILWIAS
jgi:hypothetical protein